MSAATKSAAWTAANVIMGLMFAFSVVVQFNDPDPVRWMAIYGAAMYVCLLETRRRASVLLAATIGMVAVLWAATIAPRVMGHVRFLDMFAEFEMKNAGVEESREMYGLIIVAAWMAVVALVARPRSAAARSSFAGTR